MAAACTREGPVVETGTGPAVLLVHGQPGSSADWAPLIPLLAGDHRVIAVDRPGYGASPDAAVGLEQNAFRLGQLLHQRDALGATVVGHSLGAGIALAMAERHLGAGALVLVGPAGVQGTVGALDRLLALPGVGLGVTAAHRFAQALHREDSPVLSAMAGWGPRAGGSFAREQRALLRELRVLDAQLDAVDIPVTIVVGGRDRVVHPGAQRALAARIPDARLVELPDAGHLIPLRRAAELAAIVREAVARRSPA